MACGKEGTSNRDQMTAHEGENGLYVGILAGVLSSPFYRGIFQEKTMRGRDGIGMGNGEMSVAVMIDR